MFRANALATLTAKLQSHVSALKERLENSTKEPPAGGPAGSSSSNTGPLGSAPGGAIAATSESTPTILHN